MLTAAVILLVLAVLGTAFVVACLATLWGSDAMGNGLAQAYTAVAIVVLWGVLAAAEVACAFAGHLPVWGRWALAGLVPWTLAGAVAGFALLTRRTSPTWPRAVVGLLPLLLVAVGVVAAWSRPGAVLGGEGLLAWLVVAGAVVAGVPWPVLALRRRERLRRRASS